MLKTSESKTRPVEGGVGVGGARRGGSKLDRRRIDDNKVDGNEVRDDEVETKVQKLSKSKKTELSFFTPRARKAFTKLRQAFIKAPILHHFEPIVISGLRWMHPAILLMESSVSWPRTIRADGIH